MDTGYLCITWKRGVLNIMLRSDQLSNNPKDYYYDYIFEQGKYAYNKFFIFWVVYDFDYDYRKKLEKNKRIDKRI